jgi:5'-nucleotidase
LPIRLKSGLPKLSGINLGANLGNSASHSGTLAAAKQAVLLGTRGIALSTPVEDNEPEFEALKPVVTKMLRLVIHRQKERVLNVNLPLNSKGGEVDPAVCQTV